MNVILAGATGLIGRALVPALLAEGHTVAVLTRSADPNVAGAPAVRWDSLLLDEAVLRGVDAIVNLSGATIGGHRWTDARKREILRSRVDSTGALVNAVARLSPGERPGVFLNASGIGYAGDIGDEVVTEDAGPGPDFLASVCVAWEAAALSAGVLGLRVAVLRTGVVLGRDAPTLKLLALPFRLFAGGRVGSGKQWFPWIHLDDVVRVYAKALSDPELSGPINLVAPETVRQAELARELGRALHRPAHLPTPAWALRLALGEQSQLALTGQRAESRKLDPTAFRYPHLAEALAEALG
jgi:uncharacterized protein